MKKRLNEAMKLADEGIRYILNGDVKEERKLRKKICKKYLFVEFDDLLENVNLQNINQIQYLYIIFAELGAKIFDLQSYKKAVPTGVCCNTEESFIKLMKRYSKENKEEYFRMLRLATK